MIHGLLVDKRGRLDKILLLSMIAVCLIGVLFLYSATWDRQSDPINAYVIKQILWITAGFICVFLFVNIDYRNIINYAYIAYIINLGALLFLLLFGGERFGARRWIDLGPFSIQPSEFMKVTAILVLALFLGDNREQIKSLKVFIMSFILVLPAMVLIFLQPDLGTAFVLVPITFAMLFVCGARVKYMVIVILSGVASVPLFWNLLKGYQKNRLLVFLNPDLDPLGAGYTIIQSKIAIGSGGLWGKGWLNGTQSYLKFLPERHTDFIFSVIGEEWGFVGALIVIGLYFIILLRGVSIMANAEDVYGKAVSAGIITLIAFQVIVNISMTIGMMPVVGLPLPGISYGGSNTVVALISLGFLLSISRKVQ